MHVPGSPLALGNYYGAMDRYEELNQLLYDWERWGQSCECWRAISHIRCWGFSLPTHNQSWLAALTAVLDTCRSGHCGRRWRSDPPAKAQLTFAMNVMPLSTWHKFHDSSRAACPDRLPPSQPDTLGGRCLRKRRHMQRHHG